MKKFFALIVSMMLMLLTGCGGSDQAKSDQSDQKPLESSAIESSAIETAQAAPSGSSKKILVAYFSRTGENYQVGWIEKGNTAIVAEMIAEHVDADLFEIKTVKPYPSDYRECTEVAKAELESNARPAIDGSIDLNGYDVIFLGYPIWWSDMPPVIYTFLESNDFNGRTIIPFCTSAGSYLTGKEVHIPELAKGSTIKEGFGVEGKLAQENPQAVRPKVEQWLRSLGY